MFFSNKSSNKDGFSLIELAIGIIILGLVAVYMATAVPTIFLDSSKTQNLTKSTDIAQKYLEEVKNSLSDFYEYDAVEEGSIPPVPLTNAVTDNGYFNVTTSVKFIGPAGSEDSLKEVSVTYSKKGDTTPLTTISTVIPVPPKSI